MNEDKYGIVVNEGMFPNVLVLRCVFTFFLILLPIIVNPRTPPLNKYLLSSRYTIFHKALHTLDTDPILNKYALVHNKLC